ncbi:DUF3422 family protein [Undibacterium sp.]|uniref:DUF3422 family protein n=1 Tax=Undibacterium sp. TaxID=1914977 RepID=UPI0025EFA610|nr:DUF3422 domain-containing protein [Undibacterium sp.]
MSLVYSQLNHSLRIPLAAEIHSRPSLRLRAPEAITHLAVYSKDDDKPGQDNLGLQLQILGAFCGYFGVASPAGEAKYFFHDFGRFRLKWECHTEFATFTFVENENGEDVTEHGVSEAFLRVPVKHLPQQWLLDLKGTIMVAAHVVLIPAKDGQANTIESINATFPGSVLVGSGVLQRGEVWTDFLIHPDGFSRFVVKDLDFLDQQAGRIVQRLLEIETYRMMALLGLPYAQKSAPILSVIEDELVSLTADMTMGAPSSAHVAASDEADTEQVLLRQIIDLAARTERLSTENSYRFSASKAYFRLVQSRIEELRESRIEGIPTIEEFMDRRLAPAMNTCEAILRRQVTLADRIAHTNDLLRTRVGIVQEQQNRRILQSMNARAAQQLRLQQAVEGLSVAAITYYVAGLFSYLGKAVKAIGVQINPDLVTGLLIPVIAAAVWLGLRRMHRSLSH